MTRSNDITSFTEHRRNLREHLDRVKNSGRPLFITTNGEAEAVVMSAAAYDELADQIEKAEVQSMIRESLNDIAAGRVHEPRDELTRIADNNGLRIDE